MFVLGIEAATPVAGVAVVDENKVMAERFINNKRTHSVNLLPMIKEVIADARITPQDLSCIAVSKGPGSFTGLRIGVTIAKTLAHVLNLSVAPVPTLDALAYPLTGYRGLVCPILNARKNEVYAGVYRGGEKLAGPMAVPMAELIKILNQWDERILFLGDGIEIYRHEIETALKERGDYSSISVMLPRGAAVAEIGMQMFKSGLTVDPLTLIPEYIRQSEAEVKWAERQKCNCGS